MELFVYTFKNKDGDETLCGYYRDQKPYPMVCDERQRGKLDNYAREMAKNHNMKIECHKVVTDNVMVVWDGDIETREDALEAESGDQTQ